MLIGVEDGEYPSYLYCKQIVNCYFALNYVEIVVVNHAVGRYQNKVERALVFRQLLVCDEFVLQIVGIVRADGKGLCRVFHLEYVGKAVGALHHKGTIDCGI